MRKLIAGINMTLDGYCDHTAITPDDEIHQHYADLLSSSGLVLYGRITYQLMEYWRTIVENPTGNKATDEFALTMDKIPKIVFSHTLKNVDWKSAGVATRDFKDEVAELKQQPGKDILVGSRSLIIQLMKLNLIDEYQLCVHPIVAGSGLPLFENMNIRKMLKLTKTKTFNSGAVILYYEPATGEITDEASLLKQTELDWNKAIEENDTDLMGRYMADDWVIFSGNGNVTTKERFLQMVKTGDLFHTQMDFEILNVKIYDNTAIIRQRGTSSGKWKGQTFSNYEIASSVFIKQNDRWMAVQTMIAPATKQ